MGYNIHLEAPPDASQTRKNEVKATLLIAVVEDMKWSKMWASGNLENAHFVSLQNSLQSLFCKPIPLSLFTTTAVDYKT